MAVKTELTINVLVVDMKLNGIGVSQGGEELIKGDESFIRIKNSCGDTTNFVTDKPRKVDWGLSDREKVILLGCPKCHTVSFKFD